MGKHVIEFVVEEKFKIDRSIIVEMTDEEYKDYYNGDNNIDVLFKKSRSLDEFLSRYKNTKFNKGFKILKKSNFKRDISGRDCTSFDYLHSREIND